MEDVFERSALPTSVCSQGTEQQGCRGESLPPVGVRHVITGQATALAAFHDRDADRDFEELCILAS